MDDVIEHGGHHCVKYENFFLPLLSTGIQSTHAEVRQASAYGIGVLAKYGGISFAKTLSGNKNFIQFIFLLISMNFILEFIPLLVRMIEDSNSRLAHNITATENAISAVTKILQFNSSQVSQ